MKKSDKKKLRLAALILSSVVILVVGLTIALLTDHDKAENVVVIGEVKVKLVEDFETDTVVPGKIVTKAPKVENDGKNDEFVFMEITAPMEDVIMLYTEDTDGHKKGSKMTDESAYQEIFRMIADNSSPTGSVDNTRFQYHKGFENNASPEGWVFLSKSETISTSGQHNMKYIFGYNKKLAKDASTVTLFDEVQLLSFIDEKVLAADGGSKSERITVKVYGIQSEGIDIDSHYESGKDIAEAAYVDETDLNAVFALVQQKIGGE